MQSWVRYSVAVYIGLLLAGVLVSPVPPTNSYSGPIPGEQRSARPDRAAPISLPARPDHDPLNKREPAPSGTLNS